MDGKSTTKLRMLYNSLCKRDQDELKEVFYSVFKTSKTTFHDTLNRTDLKGSYLVFYADYFGVTERELIDNPPPHFNYKSSNKTARELGLSKITT